MMRDAGFGVLVIAAVVFAGCGKSDTETPKAGPPVADSPAPTTEPSDEAPEATPAPEPSEPAAMDEASEADAPAAHEEAAPPTALGAIGKAVANTMGVGNKEVEEDMPSEAPAYQPE